VPSRLLGHALGLAVGCGFAGLATTTGEFCGAELGAAGLTETGAWVATGLLVAGACVGSPVGLTETGP
jgi:hypothetical protein